MSRFSYQNPGEAEAVLKQALALLNLFQGVADPAAEIARLRGIEAKVDKLEADLYLAGENTKSDQAYIVNLGIENARLRTLYAAAVNECRMARAALGHDTALSLRHDTARAEAGMEAL
jgi:hypothetical protein